MLLKTQTSRVVKFGSNFQVMQKAAKVILQDHLAAVTSVEKAEAGKGGMVAVNAVTAEAVQAAVGFVIFLAKAAKIVVNAAEGFKIPYCF